MATIKHPTKKAIEKLCNDLKLPNPNPFSQDWVYENTYESRINEFLSYYHTYELDDDTKFTLMIMIVNSCNEIIGNGQLNQLLWDEIQSVLVNDVHIHINTIKYWSCEGEDYEDCFNITPTIRKLCKQLEC